MSASSSDSPSPTEDRQAVRQKPRIRWQLLVGLPLWVLLGFGLAQVLVVGVLMALRFTGVSFVGLNDAVLSSVIAAVVYVLTLVIVIGLPWRLRNYRANKREMGIIRLPSWLDIGLAPVGFVVYLVCSVVLVLLVGAIVPGIDMDQSQETGFGAISHGYEYILAFITLIVIAPIAEEILFRGYLYGKLRSAMPIWLAIVVVSGLFGLVHGQWNVAIDVFALSVVLCTLREITGNIWAGVLLHMLKNSLAFYVLFVNHTFL
jgi:membrane protease YdiL (CAAX protease family)